MMVVFVDDSFYPDTTIVSILAGLVAYGHRDKFLRWDLGYYRIGMHAIHRIYVNEGKERMQKRMGASITPILLFSTQ